MNTVEKVNIVPADRLPEDYHCECEFCQKFLGTLVRPDGNVFRKGE